MITFLVSIVGAVFRRWWGGWRSPNHFLKLCVGFLLPLLMVMLFTGNSYAALWVACALEGLWLNTFNSNGFPMGRTPDKSLWYCIWSMGGSNGMYTLLAAGGLAYFLGKPLALIYGVSGFLVPFGYLLGYEIYERFIGRDESGNWKTFGGKSNAYLDGPTSIGENGLGALAIGGLAATLIYLVG